MKKFAIALVAGVMMATGVRMAQAGGGECPMCSAHMDAGKKADHMAVMLDLNDKQKAAVKDLVEAKMKKMKPAMEQMEATAKAAHEEFEAGLKKILSPKQLAKREKMEDMEEAEEKGECAH